MSGTMIQRAVVMLVVLLGCSGTQGSRSDIPVGIRPLWDQCRPAIDTWCHNRAQGDPTQERECEATTATEYVAQPDALARRQFLIAHRCPL